MLHSNFNPGDSVIVNLFGQHILGKIQAVCFTDYGKILYDVKTHDHTLKKIDSVFVEGVNNEDFG